LLYETGVWKNWAHTLLEGITARWVTITF